MGPYTVISEPFWCQGKKPLGIGVHSRQAVPIGVLPDTACYTVGVRTPQKHPRVDKATENGKKIQSITEGVARGREGFQATLSSWLKSAIGTS